ncbi:hypothetical protein RJ639_036575 [Escallonia herrerae]|uniref:NB-ARC domain-containing protein n=1 Tax=Escallonia herrerae TaxID=1293975 RepID=A0AA88X527_9ASTE|nr:hypothetical protein RJ639_036575 [Escallonia herrerae]
MAEEIEEYLLDKLSDAIKDMESSEQFLVAKLAPLHWQFSQLKEVLESKSTTSPPAEVSKVRREKLYYLSNVLTEWQMVSKRQSSISPETVLFAYKLNRRLKKVKRELKEGVFSTAPVPAPVPGTAPVPVASTQVTDGASLPQKVETYRWSTRHVDPEKIHGLGDKLLSLERLLVLRERDYGFKAIAFVGMAGIGKTALSQMIFCNSKVKESFLPRIWVCMSKQPNEDSDQKKELVKRMLMCLGVEDEIIASVDGTHGLKGLIFALRMQLVGKKYLIILDDVSHFDETLESGSSCDEEMGEQIGSGLPKGCGGTVLVTSRDEEVGKQMVGEENLHKLVPLSDKVNDLSQDQVAAFQYKLEDKDIRVMNDPQGILIWIVLKDDTDKLLVLIPQAVFLGNDISELSIVDALKLVEYLWDKLNITVAAFGPVVIAAPGTVVEVPAIVGEKTKFDVVFDVMVGPLGVWRGLPGGGKALDDSMMVGGWNDSVMEVGRRRCSGGVWAELR